MATKKALVIGSDGRIQQLQSGDSLPTGMDSWSIVQIAGVTITNPGSVVYSSGPADTVALALANASGTTHAVGLAVTAIASSGSGVIQTGGVLALTTGQWDAVTGGSGGLITGALYFLDAATGGNMTTAPPTTAGQFLVPVGVALSTTELLIRIAESILL